MEYFGIKLKKLRENREMSQAQLAERLGVAIATVSAYEQDRTLPSVTILIKICRIFDVSADYLLGLSDDMIKRKAQLTLGQTEAIKALINALESDNMLRE